MQNKEGLLLWALKPFCSAEKLNLCSRCFCYRVKIRLDLGLICWNVHHLWPILKVETFKLGNDQYILVQQLAFLIRLVSFWKSRNFTVNYWSRSVKVYRRIIYKMFFLLTIHVKSLDFETYLATLCMTRGQWIWRIKFTYQRQKDEGMNVQYCL